RNAGDEQREVATSPRPGVALEGVPPGEHHRDEGARQVLADGDRPGHRQQGDDVDTEVAPGERPRYRPRERDEQCERRRGPAGAREARVAEPPGDSPTSAP